MTSSRWKIIEGDLRRPVLIDVGSEPFDAVLCDPPYELGFMGKKWDASGVAFSVKTWQWVFQQLRPGAPLLAFGGTRTYHRMTCAIEDSGFEIRDCLMWLYGSGFPKSLDVSKALDKRVGAERTKVVGHKNSGLDSGRSSVSFEGATGRDDTGLIPITVSTSERNDGLDDLPVLPASVVTGRGSKSYDECGVDQHASRAGRTGTARNSHPTLKPIALTEYLAKLILPPRIKGRTRRLLVPFSGAASEMIGALRAGWDEVVGIEQSPEYAKIARLRLERMDTAWRSSPQDARKKPR